MRTISADLGGALQVVPAEVKPCTFRRAGISNVYRPKGSNRIRLS